MTKPRAPFDPKLPGGFGRMTREELDAESDKYDAEFSTLDFREPTPEELASHPRKRPRGRPAKAPSERSLNVMVSFPPDVLKLADRQAKRRKLTRAGLIHQLIRADAAAAKKPAKPSRRKSA